MEEQANTRPHAPSRTVYSIYYPETRSIVEGLWASRPHGWYEDNHTKKQDEMHEPYLAAWRAWSGIQGLEGFPHGYPTNGASEPIAHLNLMAAVRRDPVHMFAGDYEGFSYHPNVLGMPMYLHDRRDPLKVFIRGGVPPKGLFWLSAPSSIDGEQWYERDEWLTVMARRYPTVEIVVDVTYVGAVKTKRSLDLSRFPNVKAVVFSLSKPFGVYFHRIGGIVSRRPLPTLTGNVWFKGLFGIHLGRMLMELHPADDLPNRYAHVQKAALARLIAAGAVPDDATPSNVVMLARSYAPKPAMTNEFSRGPAALRYCLKAEMSRIIQEEKGVRT